MTHIYTQTPGQCLHLGVDLSNPVLEKQTCEGCGTVFMRDPEWGGKTLAWGTTPPEPTKQRPGDQVLPSGGQECVQDAVIAAMEESKRVGTERYGTPLMTFNGRKGFQDVADEIRDLFVYFTMIQSEAEATRKTLVRVVAWALADPVAPLPEWMKKAALGYDMTPIAEIAVDRIMGWVTGTTMQMQGWSEKALRAEIEYVLDKQPYDGTESFETMAANHRELARDISDRLMHIAAERGTS